MFLIDYQIGIKMDIIAEWFNEALKLDPGESIYIPVTTKKESARLQRAFLKHKDAVQKISPEKAYLVSITVILRDVDYFVVLKKGVASPFIAFKKGPSGEIISTVSLSTLKSERERRRLLMRRDGISTEEIDAIEKAEDETYLKEYSPNEN